MSNPINIPLRNGIFPQSPGVYWYLNHKGKVLYVGKAKNLKNRILSYRRLTNDSLKTKQMLSKAKNIKFKTTDSELEALILEAELIRFYQPFYNLRLTDDKSPLYIYITSTPFPHVKTGRKEILTKLKITKANRFGPYPSGLKAKEVLKFLRSIFPFCNATETQIKKHQACFYSHLNLCPGACKGEISQKDYLKNIQNLKLFLKGQKKSVIKSLKSELKQISQHKKFEQAIILRDQIITLESLAKTPQKPELNLPNLEQDEADDKLKALQKILRLHTSLPKNFPLKRIEAYDVSNLEGQQATASMVVFVNGKPKTSEYRLFKIKNLKTPNDPAMLKEALTRRIKHPEWKTPNLIVIDGGLTQLKAALSTIPWHLPIVSIAKNPDRLLIPSTPSGFIPEVHNSTPTGFILEGKPTTLVLKPHQPASRLLLNLRDESHRFARNYHLKLRLRHLQGSSL
jgi:excinuclease ABC subunit C